MMDRITAIDLDGGAFGKGHVAGELDVVPDHWFFACHFAGDPVMPGCLGLDAMWQIIGFWLGWSGSPGKGRALGVGEVKFRGTSRPTSAWSATRSTSARSGAAGWCWASPMAACSPTATVSTSRRT